MNIIALIPLALNALIAIPKIGDMVMSAVNQVVQWWIQRQTNETLGQISDAAALGARAKTDADRYAVAAKWQEVLQRARVSQ